MRDWSYTLDKVNVQSKQYKAGDVAREYIANISDTQKKESVNGSEVYAKYGSMFGAVESGGVQPVLVPLHSAWFSIEKVNEIERRAFPALQAQGEEGEKEEARYKKVRNMMFMMFQDNTESHLSITQCRRSIVEDVETIIRIHAFMEHWGLINYKIGCKRDIKKMLKRLNEREVYRTEKETKEYAETKSKEENSEKVAIVYDAVVEMPRASLSTQIPPANMLRDMSKHFSAQSNGPKMTEIPLVTNCTECARMIDGRKSDEQMYVSDKEQVVLCRACYKEGRYSVQNSYMSFHVLEAGVIRQIWTAEEEMLLVEGLELYKDDWKAVCAYVKTKTVEQCVLHFLKMGIQDPCVEMESVSYMENKLPFNYSLNPVMATVAFLASVVHPGVASAAAKAAMEEIQKIANEKEQRGERSEKGDINERLNEIAAVALASCVARASEQKALEEGKKERLLELLVESEMKRIEEKVAEYTDLAQTLKKEREDLEKMRETYRRAHIEARKEISDILCKVKRMCEETGMNFEEVLHRE